MCYLVHETTQHVSFNCFSVFRENRGSRGGTVVLLYFPVHFNGTNTFISNVGPTIRVFAI